MSEMNIKHFALHKAILSSLDFTNVYHKLFLLSYYQYIGRCYTPSYIEMIVTTLSHEDSIYGTRALLDTILIDSILFSQLNTDNEIDYYYNSWRNSNSDNTYVPRSNAQEIKLRLTPLVQLILSRRSFINIDQKEFLIFLSNYFLSRQICDDFSDRRNDLKNSIYTPVTLYGAKYARTLLRYSYQRMLSTKVPLYYINLSKLYWNWFYKFQ